MPDASTMRGDPLVWLTVPEYERQNDHVTRACVKRREHSWAPSWLISGLTALPSCCRIARCAYPGVMGFHGYVGVQGRGVVALPAELRRRFHLDEPGAQVEITEREDGVLELRPSLPIPVDQRWFWTQRWQEREREVDEDVAAGRMSVHDDGDALLAHLDSMTDQR